MSVLAQILVADLPTAAPRRGETVVWIGVVDPPPNLAGHPRIVRARTSAEAVALITLGPAVVRFALQQPLGFVKALATPERFTEARAA
jgi:hypothetical protein